MLLEASLALRRDLGDRRGVALSLEGFALLAAALGQPRRGTQLWGAADSLRQAIGETRWPVEQAEYEQSIVTLRAALGEEGFAAAWAEGRVLSLDAAVALALQDSESSTVARL